MRNCSIILSAHCVFFFSLFHVLFFGVGFGFRLWLKGVNFIGPTGQQLSVFYSFTMQTLVRRNEKTFDIHRSAVGWRFTILYNLFFIEKYEI